VTRMDRILFQDSRKLAAVAALAATSLLLGACLSPVRAVRSDRTEAHRDLTRSVVTTGELSWETRDVLLERGLLDDYETAPEQAIATLHQELATSASPALLYALAEASYLHGEKNHAHEHLLAAVVYAWAFLFPASADADVSSPFDPRFRGAADLYNFALSAAFASEDHETMQPRGGSFALPFGSIDVAFEPSELRAGSRELYDFVPSTELEVRGLAMRYRRPGIGAPLAASTRHVGDGEETDMVAPRLRVPVTALLRVADARQSLVEGRPLSATLELHLAWDDESVTIDGREVPLENEPSAALAYTFNGVPVVQLEIFGFFGRLTGLLAERPPLVSTTPYKPGLVPVVFVHGTASSPVRWAELFNRLEADPDLRARYQFWFFQYDSDNPIALSALRLRQSLGDAVQRLDPDGKDEALRRMVLIGHSQGGLLVRMQSIETGDRLWSSVSRKPIEELRLTDANRDLLTRAFFLEPLPEVSRVIFISTPHRGSFLAASRIVTNLLRRFTHLPGRITMLSSAVARNLDAAMTPYVPTAVDNMAPHHPFILVVQEIPVAESIHAHSIISVIPNGPVEEGDDGVVKYTSAHIEGVDSEVVVPSPHSCQGHPDTMEEVRRILRLHAGLPTADGDEK